MASPAGDHLFPATSIDVLKDLPSFSALKSMLSGSDNVIFNIAGALLAPGAANAGQAAANGASARISPAHDCTWKTSTGIELSLSPSANCSLAFGLKSTTFQTATTIEESPAMTDVECGPTPNVVYVNIDLDFDIKHGASGGAVTGGLGISGKASGGAETTLSFCQPVNASLPVVDAVKEALSRIVFPVDPGCIEAMTPGALAKINFDGTLDCELDASYGLGDYKVSAPDVAKVEQSLKNIVQIKLPTADVKAGIQGFLRYTHSDHFGLIASKTDDQAGTLYLVRAAKDELTGSIGISADISVSDASVTVDQQVLQQALQSVCKNAELASKITEQVSTPLNNLQTGLSAKLKSWTSDVTGQVGLTAGLSRQAARTALFVFAVDLSTAKAGASWSALINGNIAAALRMGGFTLQSGSGVSESLNRAAKLNLQFFNLYTFNSVTDYFSNAYSELAPDGTIRLYRDVGQEQSVQTKNALAKFRIHFVAKANADAAGNISASGIDLCLELSEKGDSSTARAMLQSLATLPSTPATQKATAAMSDYFSSHRNGTMLLNAVIRESAYGKLAATRHGASVPPLPHPQDENNWNAFQLAAARLCPNLAFIPPLNYSFWAEWNRLCIDQPGSTIPPDRRQAGNPSAVPPGFYERVPGNPNGELVRYFLAASSGFMNLCDDLHSLAQAEAGANTDTQWKNVLEFVTSIVTKDVLIDYGKPTAAALLHQAAAGASQIATSVDVDPDFTHLTCNVTIG